jgi:hypothetical protein
VRIINAIIIATVAVAGFVTPQIVYSQTVERGRIIFEKIAKKSPQVRPMSWGLATEMPKLALFIPKQEWAELSREDQVSLSLYVESLIPSVRANPQKYTDGASQKSLTPAARSKVAKLCKECWLIGVGSPSLEGKEILYDEVVVQGDAAWEKDNPRSRGAKASEFRQITAANPAGEENAARLTPSGSQQPTNGETKILEFGAVSVPREPQSLQQAAVPQPPHQENAEELQKQEQLDTRQQDEEARQRVELIARAERQTTTLQQTRGELAKVVNRIADELSAAKEEDAELIEETRHARTLMARVEWQEKTLRQAKEQLVANLSPEEREKHTVSPANSNKERVAAQDVTNLLRRAQQQETTLRQAKDQLQKTARRRQQQEQEVRLARQEARPTEAIGDPLQREEALLAQAERGETSRVEALLKAGTFANVQDAKSWTPLMLAATHGHMATVQALLNRGADVNIQNDTGGTALMLVAMTGHEDTLQVLLENGARVNARNVEGWTALMYAAWNGRTSIVETLLNRGAEVNAKNAEGWTALMYATWNGHLDTVRALLDGRAEPHETNSAGESALTVAASRGNTAILELLQGARSQQEW